jgi:hypothetical protein
MKPAAAKFDLISSLDAIDHRRVAIDRIWVLDILKKYQAIQHQRR